MCLKRLIKKLTPAACTVPETQTACVTNGGHCAKEATQSASEYRHWELNVTCRMPGSRSEKCFSRAVLPSFDRTKADAARAARVRI